MTERLTGERMAQIGVVLVPALCFVGLPLLLFGLWYLEIGRAAHWEAEMCLMPWLPGLYFAWIFGGDD